MIKNITIGIILFISIGLNAWFFAGKGIIVNRDERVINNNNNSQWQGQLLINQWNAQGNKIEWKEIRSDVTNYLSELNTLHPISSMYSKIYRSPNRPFVIIIYPEIFKEKK